MRLSILMGCLKVIYALMVLPLWVSGKYWSVSTHLPVHIMSLLGVIAAPFRNLGCINIALEVTVARLPSSDLPRIGYNSYCIMALSVWSSSYLRVQLKKNTVPQWLYYTEKGSDRLLQSMRSYKFRFGLFERILGSIEYVRPLEDMVFVQLSGTTTGSMTWLKASFQLIQIMHSENQVETATETSLAYLRLWLTYLGCNGTINKCIALPRIWK